MSNGALGNRAHHQRIFRVRASEAGPEGRVRLGRYLDYFQEAAAEHAAILGASVLDLLARNVTWVISRYHVKIWRYPLWGETITLTTWPSGLRNLFALREFEVSAEGGELIAAATSSWMMIDLKTKRPVPPQEHLPVFCSSLRRAVDDDFRPLPIVRKQDREVLFSVRRHDLDWNRHANHVVYVEWATETPPREFLENYLPGEIEIDYRGEAFIAETVVSRVEYVGEDERPVVLHQIVRASDDKELARLRTRWRHQGKFQEKRHD